MSSEIKAKAHGKRKETESKNIAPQQRQGSVSIIANQYHNELQNELFELLKKQYGDRNVHMEKNYVDIIVELQDKEIYYEVKSDSFASQCIRQALGQLLSYVHNNSSTKNVELVVYGKNHPNPSEEKFIKYVSDTLNIPFQYICRDSFN